MNAKGKNYCKWVKIYSSATMNNVKIALVQRRELELIEKCFSQVNTEPSINRNIDEGVETTIEKLRNILNSMLITSHERSSNTGDSSIGRYSPNLQETVRGKDKEPYVNNNVIYAPYIPLFSTPTLVTADLRAQKGFLSAAGFKIINPGMFTYGSVIGLL